MLGSAVAAIIGINCSSQYAFVAIVENGAVIDREPARLELPALEASERLSVFIDDTAGDFAMLRAIGLSVLKAEQPPPGTRVAVAAVYARATLETLVRLAAVRAGLPVEMTSRRTVRSRLNVPAGGKLTEHIGAVFPDAVGRYWAAGRALAAMAALAMERA